MKVGILADIHEHTAHLRAALHKLRLAGAEQMLALGDVCEDGRRLAETTRLLVDAGAIGVWGNHDFGLCQDPDADIPMNYSAEVLSHLRSYQPRIEIDGCLFTHVEPWLDPYDLAQLWYFDGPPDTREKAQRSFGAVPQRVIILGHFHRWLAVGADGRLDWSGTTPLILPREGRCLIVVAAVCDGHCAVFDTQTMTLTPM